MSEADGSAGHGNASDRHDPAWASAMARGRGLNIDAEAAQRLSDFVAPVLAHFSRLAAELAADDDMYEFRRFLAAEGQRD
jgi:hypothetical protein